MASSSESPAHQLLYNLTGGPPGDPVEAMDGVRPPSTELEDFRPLANSLEWRLAQAYWATAGALPFVRNDVPYLVNNTGRLSENAAELVFAAWCERAAALPERLVIVELGAGTGLFARYFLDAFAACCQKEGRDFYDRLTYVVTDAFAGTLRVWAEAGLFAPHEARVQPRVCDAARPDTLSRLDGAPAALPGPPQVVFCNYVMGGLFHFGQPGTTRDDRSGTCTRGLRICNTERVTLTNSASSPRVCLCP